MAVNVDTFVQLLNTFEFTNRIFIKGRTISALDSSQNYSTVEKPWDKFTQTQVFGFVPVFDDKGVVSLYIRFGGPELIVKHFGNMDVEIDANEFDEQYPSAKAFSTKFDEIYGGHEYVNYAPTHALERLLLQRTMNNPAEDAHYPSQFKAQVMALYPLRLVPDFATKKFELQYAPMGATEYGTINNANHYANLIIEILTSLIKKAMLTNVRDDEIREMLKFCKNSTNITNLSKAVFIDRLQKDLDNAVQANLLTYMDRVGGDNGFDTPFVAAFAQLLDTVNSAVSAVHSKAKEIIDSIPTLVNQATVNAMCNLVASYFMKWGLDSEGADTALKAEIATKTKAIEELKATQTKAIAELNASKSELEAKLVANENAYNASNASDRNKERLIGAASAAAVTVWAMQSEDLKSLDMLQKGILVAVGGVLGAVMPSGYTPLAVLAAPITATTVGKQLVKHEITADRASAKASELKDRATAKYEELSQRRAEAASRANPKSPKRKKRKAKR